jgi:hypothetical protein
VAYKRSWQEIFRPIFTKKEKRTKKERKPVETAAAVEIDQGSLRRLLLMISTSRLKKPRTERSGFFTVPTGSATTNHPLPSAEETKTGTSIYTKLRTHPKPKDSADSNG